MTRFDYQQQGVILRGALGVLHECQDPLILIEGRRGTAKTTGICKKLVDCCASYPGARILIVRQTRESLTDSVLPTLEKVIGPNHPEVLRMGRMNRHSYDLYGSEIVVGGLDKPAKMYSTEWDLVYVAEAIETSKDAVEQFGACMRNFRMPYQQIICDTNPGAPGHWLNQTATGCPDSLRAVITKKDYYTLDQYNSGPQNGTMRRLVSVHQDNPMYWNSDAWDWTALGRQYVETRLAPLTGHRRVRFFEGRWANAEGSVFGNEFNEDRNVIDDFNPPSSWPRWVSIDPGYTHNCACGWHTVSPTGKKITFHEVCRSSMTIQETADRIHEFNGERSVNAYYLDPRHGFAKTYQSNGVTIAEQFAKYGIHCLPYPPAQGSSLDASVELHRDSLLAGTYLVCRGCVVHIQEHQGWMYKKNAKGEFLSGDAQYEDKGNDSLDETMGWERTHPQFDHASHAVIVGEGIYGDETEEEY